MGHQISKKSVKKSQDERNKINKRWWVTYYNAQYLSDEELQNTIDTKTFLLYKDSNEFVHETMGMSKNDISALLYEQEARKKKNKENE